MNRLKRIPCQIQRHFQRHFRAHCLLAVAFAAALLVMAPLSDMAHGAEPAELTEEHAAALERKINALPSERKGEITLRTITSHESIAAEDTFLVAIDFRIRFGWHMYAAQEGGDYVPVRLKWELPEGFEVTATQWTKPEIEDGKPQYRRRARVVATLKAPRKLPEGKLPIHATVTWQVCKEVCRVGSLKMPIDIDTGASKFSMFSPLLQAQSKPSKPSESK